MFGTKCIVCICFIPCCFLIVLISGLHSKITGTSQEVVVKAYVGERIHKKRYAWLVHLEMGVLVDQCGAALGCGPERGLASTAFGQLLLLLLQFLQP